MIYLDASALLKFIKLEKETDALRSWRLRLPTDINLVTSELARLEIGRTLLRGGGLAPQRLHETVEQALGDVIYVDLTKALLARAMDYSMPKLGSLDAIHLATAEPFRAELTEFITYDNELASAATELGLPVVAPA